MATTVARLQAVLGADTRGFDRDMDRSDRRFGGLAKAAGVGMAAVGVAAVAGFKVFGEEAIEAQKVTAQTEAVIKSTGGTANVTAAQVDALSGALMRKSGVDDEAIKSGQNMLLTFTNVRNEVGAGNDVFNQASSTLLDMSVAMGTDMSKQAVQLGKALNDPIKGIGALSRVGVTFTEDQKEMIKGMVAAGNTMGAQKLILAELGKEFGGSAEAAGKTFGGQVAIAKNQIMNMGGEIVAGMLPALSRFVTVIATEVMPRLQQWIAALVDHLRPAFVRIVAFMQENWPVVKEALRVVWEFVDKNVLPVVAQLRDAFVTMVNRIRAVLQENEKEVDRILDGVRKVLDGIGWVLRNVVAPALVFALEEVLPRAIGVAIKVVSGVEKSITAVVRGIATAADAVRDAFVWIRDHVASIFTKTADALDKPAQVAKKAFDLWLTPLKLIKEAIEWLAEHAEGILGKVAGLIGKVPGIGDPFSPNLTFPGLPSDRGREVGSVNLMGARPEMLPFGVAAAAHGLYVTSGLRPGAITRSGTLSDHALGKALDVAGAASGMAGFFQSLLGNPAVKQAFYDPLGSIFGGRWSSYREGGHSDHVHVATYDKGGYLKPGWNLAYNGLGRPEPVGAGGPTVIVNGVVGDAEDVARKIRDALLRIQRRDGTLGFGTA